MQHIVIRREDYVVGTVEGPQVGVFTQTNEYRRPTPWDRISIGDIVWMKWSGGPIVAKSVVQGFRQLEGCSREELQETTKGTRLYKDVPYWESLIHKPSFNAVIIYVEHEEWLEEVIEPVARSYGNSWIVLGNDSTSGWLTSEGVIKPIELGVKSTKRGISAGLRFRILKRDGFTCWYCGATPQDNRVKLHVDHIKPRVEGGSNDEDNLVTACMDCNLGKGRTELDAKRRPFSINNTN